MQETGYYWVRFSGMPTCAILWFDGEHFTSGDIKWLETAFEKIYETRILSPDEQNPLIKAQVILDSLPSNKEFLRDFFGAEFPKPVFPDGYIPGFTEYVKAAYPNNSLPMDIKVKQYINFVNGLTH